jgi:hypothetical protein
LTKLIAEKGIVYARTRFQFSLLEIFSMSTVGDAVIDRESHILFGERSLRRALQQYTAHYHEERNHQGRQNLLLFPRPSAGACKAEGTIRFRERLDGLLKFYDRQAA